MRYQICLEILQDGQGVNREIFDFPEGATREDVERFFLHLSQGGKSMMALCEMIIKSNLRGRGDVQS